MSKRRNRTAKSKWSWERNGNKKQGRCSGAGKGKKKRWKEWRRKIHSTSRHDNLYLLLLPIQCIINIQDDNTAIRHVQLRPDKTWRISVGAKFHCCVLLTTTSVFLSQYGILCINKVLFYCYFSDTEPFEACFRFLDMTWCDVLAYTGQGKARVLLNGVIYVHVSPYRKCASTETAKHKWLQMAE